MKYYKTTACVHIPELRGSYPEGTVIEVSEDNMMRIGVIEEPLSGGFRILQRYGMVVEISKEEAEKAENAEPIAPPARPKMPVTVKDDVETVRDLPQDEEEDEPSTEEEAIDPSVKTVRGMKVVVMDEISRPLPADGQKRNVPAARNELPETNLEEAKKEAEARKAERRAKVMENLQKAREAKAAKAKKSEEPQDASPEA